MHRAVGYRITFCDHSHTGEPGKETTYPKGSSLNKGAIEPVPFSQTIPPTTPICPGFVHGPSFTMETPRSILGTFRKGQWLTSQNLKILPFYGRHTDLVHTFYTSVSHMLKSLFIECDI